MLKFNFILLHCLCMSSSQEPPKSPPTTEDPLFNNGDLNMPTQHEQVWFYIMHKENVSIGNLFTILFVCLPICRPPVCLCTSLVPYVLAYLYIGPPCLTNWPTIAVPHYILAGGWPASHPTDQTSKRQSNCQTSQLINWLTEWLIKRLASCLDGCLVSWLAGWLASCLHGRRAGSVLY